MDTWPFDQAPNVAAITTARVLDGAAVRLVVHYSSDHSWAFLDGGAFDVAQGKVVGMAEMLNLDPSLAEVSDLPPGWTATRSHLGAPWHRAADSED